MISWGPGIYASLPVLMSRLDFGFFFMWEEVKLVFTRCILFCGNRGARDISGIWNGIRAELHRIKCFVSFEGFATLEPAEQRHIAYTRAAMFGYSNILERFGNIAEQWHSSARCKEVFWLDLLLLKLYCSQFLHCYRTKVISVTTLKGCKFYHVHLPTAQFTLEKSKLLQNRLRRYLLSGTLMTKPK